MAADVRGFYSELGVKVPPSAQTNVDLRCFAEGDAHKNGDRKPSLSLNVETGQWHCHGCGASGGTYKAALALGRDKAAALRLEERFGLREASNGHREIVAEYDYTDETGRLLFQVVRFARRTSGSASRTAPAVGNGSSATRRRVLYRLPKLREAIGAGRGHHGPRGGTGCGGARGARCRRDLQSGRGRQVAPRVFGGAARREGDGDRRPR